jgi:hypothetical protein
MCNFLGLMDNFSDWRVIEGVCLTFHSAMLITASKTLNPALS